MQAEIDPEATVLIAGGAAGGVGALLARRLVEQGARHLLLLSRRGLEAAGMVELSAELTELGAVDVRIESCDVAERARLSELLDSIPAEHPLGTVIHLAAAVEDGVLCSLDPERLAGPMRPKADGAWNLHELTREMELSPFVLFSSAAGVLGAPGQANYAAANAFLDALAAYRRAEGLPASAWLGALGDAGSDMVDDAAAMATGRAGPALARPPRCAEQGLELFDARLGSGRPAGAWPSTRGRCASLAEAGSLPAILAGWSKCRHGSGSQAGALAARFAAAAAEEREAIVLEPFVRRRRRARPGSAEAVEPERPSRSSASTRSRRSSCATGSAPTPVCCSRRHWSSTTPRRRQLPASWSLSCRRAARRRRGQPGRGGAREALARVPHSRLREGGLLEDLMELVGLDPGAEGSSAGDLADDDRLDGRRGPGQADPRARRRPGSGSSDAGPGQGRRRPARLR